MSDDDSPVEDRFPPRKPTLSDVGIPISRDLAIHSVSYNKGSASFVVVLQPRKFIHPACQRVFVRGPGEFKYREVALPDPLAHVSDAVVCYDAPSVFLNIGKWRDAEMGSSDTLGLYRVSLPSGALEKLPDPTDPIDAPDSIWATTILSASPDGTELHLILSVNAVMRVPRGTGETRGFFLATYATDSGIVKILDEVPAVFA